MSPDTQDQARSGMLAGGNWIIDQVKIIDVYPKHEQLANIFDQSQGTGGSPYNVLLDLAKMGAGFPLQGAGLVGQDALGEYIIEDCRRHNIDPKFISVSPGTSTSYTDVMTEREGGRRTFFHNRGANATWDGSEIDFSTSSAKIFHLGYLLLLDAIDQSESEHGTVGAALLAKARAAGMKTSIDVVSEDSDRFAKIIGPALKQVDYCILNEVEGSKVTGVEVRRDGNLLNDGIEETASKLFELGVGDLVAIHFPEGSYAQSKDGERYGTVPLLCRRDTSRVRRVQEMLFVPECFTVCMKIGHSRNPCSPEPVRQLPACLILPVRMDCAHWMSALPLPKNSESGKTKRKKNFSSLSLGSFSEIKGIIL